MAALKWLAVVVGLVALGVLVLLVGARFADGPLEIVAGGPFRSGEAHSGPEPDWSFLRDVQTVEFQLLEPARSRTTWVVEVDGRVFIPSGYMTTWYGKIWKQWPFEALERPDILLRVDGTVYERKLVRIEQDRLLPKVIERISEKYVPFGVDAVHSGYVWIFELVPRTA